jgi:hypothetical protein
MGGHGFIVPTVLQAPILRADGGTIKPNFERIENRFLIAYRGRKRDELIDLVKECLRNRKGVISMTYLGGGTRDIPEHLACHPFYPKDAADKPLHKIYLT